jgi:hypothetical protein
MNLLKLSSLVNMIGQRKLKNLLKKSQLLFLKIKENLLLSQSLNEKIQRRK